MGGWDSTESSPSLLTTLSPPERIIAVVLVFGFFAYAWYAAFLTHARLGGSNIHYVGRDVVKRLDAQAKGEDPPELKGNDNVITQTSVQVIETKADQTVLQDMPTGSTGSEANDGKTS